MKKVLFTKNGARGIASLSLALDQPRGTARQFGTKKKWQNFSFEGFASNHSFAGGGDSVRIVSKEEDCKNQAA